MLYSVSFSGLERLRKAQERKDKIYTDNDTSDFLWQIINTDKLWS